MIFGALMPARYSSSIMSGFPANALRPFFVIMYVLPEGLDIKPLRFKYDFASLIPLFNRFLSAEDMSLTSLPKRSAISSRSSFVAKFRGASPLNASSNGLRISWVLGTGIKITHLVI